jgi:hypothetical protein
MGANDTGATSPNGWDLPGTSIGYPVELPAGSFGIGPLPEQLTPATTPGFTPSTDPLVRQAPLPVVFADKDGNHFTVEPDQIGDIAPSVAELAKECSWVPERMHKSAELKGQDFGLVAESGDLYQAYSKRAWSSMMAFEAVAQRLEALSGDFARVVPSYTGADQGAASVFFRIPVQPPGQ